MKGAVTGDARFLLRLEGAATLCAATVGYAAVDPGWWMFAILFFVPDLSMAGYLAGRRAGAILYNAAHWYALPLLLVAWGTYAPGSQASALGLIWLAHIGLDRAMGYGLKYPEGFGHTHLGRIGRSE